MSGNTWRLIIDPPADGAWNMAVDEAILDGITSGQSTPTLRLYAWQPACLSLGYAQPASDVDFEALQNFGWTCVRRPTGGRAILHTDELTYSVIGPASDPRLAGGVLESYRRLSGALLHALQLLELPAQADKEYTKSPHANANGPVCFEVPSNYEITVNRKKLIGSAQARRRDGVLQHGSLPLTGDLTRITYALKYESTEDRHLAAERLLERALTVENAINRVITWQEAAQAFITAFQTILELHLEPGELLPIEVQAVEVLQSQKYAHSSWTNRV